MKSNVKSPELATENAMLKSKVSELEALVKYYEEQFRLAKHRQFGASSEKSEYDFGQHCLFNEAELFSDSKTPEPELLEIEKHYCQRTRLTTDTLPEAECSCPVCAGALHIMGTEVRRELVVVPAQVKIREHVRNIYSCRHCEQTAYTVTIVKTPMPQPVIKGCFASPEVVAHIAAQKFVMGLPLYRQEQEWKRQGILLSRQTLSNWLLRVTEDWLEPIYNRLHDQLCSREVLHTDEPTLQVLRELGKTSQSKSYMWLYRTSGDADHPIVLYEYQPDRKANHPETCLHDFKGYLHADGYHTLSEGITVVGCWAHLRRKFDEVLKVLPAEAKAGGLALVGKRYWVRV